MANYCEKYNIPMKKYKDHWGYEKQRYEEDKRDYGTVGKQYCFCYKDKNYRGEEFINFKWMSSLNKFLVSSNDEVNENYPEYYELLQSNPCYSPVDDSKDTYQNLTYEEFYERAYSKYYERTGDVSFYSNITGEVKPYRAATYNSGLYILQDDKYNKVLDIFPTREEKGYYSWRIEKNMIPVTFEEIYNKMKPICIQKYLKNGKKYKKEYC